MSTFIFVVLIPVMISTLLAHLGYGIIQDPFVFVMIMLPVCFVCAAINSGFTK